MAKQNKKLNFQSDEEAEEYFKKHPIKLDDAQLNPYAEKLKKEGALLIIRNKDGDILEMYRDNRVEIERDLFNYFHGNSQKINTLLRQVIEMDKALHESVKKS